MFQRPRELHDRRRVELETGDGETVFMMEHDTGYWNRFVVDLWKQNVKNHKLVGGWATPLKNMISSIGMMTRNPILMGK